MLALPTASPTVLQAALDATSALTEAPFGVNFLMPMVNPAAVEVAAGHAKVVEFFYGAPEPELVQMAKASGAVAGWQVGSMAEAEEAVIAGCDYVVAQGVEAGGHVRGSMSLWSLLEQLIGHVDVPVIAAGGLGTKTAVAAALAAGADGVRVGTRFVATHEANAHPDYIDALVSSTAADTVLTTAFGVGWPDAPHRVLQAAVDRATDVARKTETAATITIDGVERQLPVFGPSSPTKESVGNVDALAHYAGQSVDAVTSRQSAADVVAELIG